MKTEVNKCNLCGFTYFEEFVRVPDFSSNSTKKYSFFKCKICGLFQQNPIPSSKEIETFYPKDYGGNMLEKKIENKDLLYMIKNLLIYIHKKYIIANNFKEEISCFDKYIRHNNIEKLKILDIGCGAGEFAKKMKNLGHQVYVLDIDPEVIEYLNGLKINASLSFFHDYNTKEKFDIVYMSHSLEHVPDVAETLKKAKSLLKKNGMVYIKVPNISSLCFFTFKQHARLLDLPRHIFMFSPKTISNFLEVCGFKKIDLSTKIHFHFVESSLNKLSLFYSVRKLIDNFFIIRIMYSITKLSIEFFVKSVSAPLHLIFKNIGEEIRVIAYNND